VLDDIDVGNGHSDELVPVYPVMASAAALISAESGSLSVDEPEGILVALNILGITRSGPLLGQPPPDDVE
jgi:hypothetical protein